MIDDLVAVSERFDEHDGSAVGQLCLRMGGDPDRVTHVVETVKEADEVELAPEGIGGGDLEMDAVADSGDPGAFACSVDRRRVEVEAVQLGIGVGLSHHHRGDAVPTTDISDLGPAVRQ